MSLKQKLSIKTTQKLSPNRIQLMKLIQMPLLDLEHKVEQEMAENPALTDIEDDQPSTETDEEYQEASDSDAEDTTVEDTEGDEEVEDPKSEEIEDDLFDENDDYESKIYNQSQADDGSRQIADYNITLRDALMQQLRTMSWSSEKMILAEYLIGTLDVKGYLARPLDDIVDDIAFSHRIKTSFAALENVLMGIQRFDPPGVASRDLRECLILQLNRSLVVGGKFESQKRLALRTLTEAIDLFLKNKRSELATKFEVREDQIHEVFDLIKGLNPKPGLGFGSGDQTAIIPDFIATIRNDEVWIEINNRNAPRLFVSKSYVKMLSDYEEASTQDQNNPKKKAVQFIRDKMGAARNFIDSIYQREHTLLKVMMAISYFQQKYFITGERSDIKPMILKDIAQMVNMDISTISRVVSKKYVSTPYGIISLKEIFSEKISTDSGEVSNIKVKELIKSMINKENKSIPLSDEQMAKILQSKGFVTARRTVSKYREQLKIPVARFRKM